MNHAPVSTEALSATSPISTEAPPRPARILSVDALRGFDMFWIIGGEEIAKAFEGFGSGVINSAVATQFKHAEWVGFHFFDAIFPLFLFLIGVSIVLSMDRVLAATGRRAAVVRIARRSLLLFVIGIFYYGGLARNWPDVALSGVLQRIALCYFFAATLYVFLPRRGIVIAAAVSLVGYGAMLTFVPFPDVNLKHATVNKKDSQGAEKPPAVLLAGVTRTVTGTFDEGRNLANYIDYRALPGKKRNLYYTNEGLLSTIPAVATTLFGIMAGWLLTSARWSGLQKVGWLFGAGALAIAIGALWGLQIPVIKRIWTPSFCLVASGVSSLFLGAFYLLVDVWHWRKWCMPFLWIGSNALAVYLVVEFIDFAALADRLVGGDVSDFFDTCLGAGFGELVIALVALLLPVVLVRYLYLKKVFIRL